MNNFYFTELSNIICSRELKDFLEQFHTNSTIKTINKINKITYWNFGQFKDPSLLFEKRSSSLQVLSFSIYLFDSTEFLKETIKEMNTEFI